MNFCLSEVQESIEHRKEIAPANEIPKKSPNLSTLLENHQKVNEEMGMPKSRKLTFSDLGAFQLHFRTQVVFFVVWMANYVKMDPKWSLKDSLNT